MTLMLHAGATPVEYSSLVKLPMPEATATHVPIAHTAVVDMVKFSLSFYGHEIVEEHFGVTPDGLRFFGLLSLRSSYGDYTDTVGLRNSHDKRFPIGISFGSRVFVCDNLAFAGDHVIRRKHTARAKRDLPGLVAEVVEPLRDERLRQAQTFERYRTTLLTEPQVHDAIMRLYKLGVINVTRIAEVLSAFEAPPFDWGDRSLWRLFNAVTYVVRGRVVENPATTRQLHTLMDRLGRPGDPGT